VIAQATREALADQVGRIEFDAPLARHTSLRVGGPADAIASPSNRRELGALLKLCQDHRIPFHVLGAGFNTLVRDEGIEGVVVSMRRMRGLALEQDSIRAEAGTSHSQITNFGIEHGRSGLEFAAGIPGTVGGWVTMNAGIGVREIETVIEDVDWIGPGGNPGTAGREELEFRYREFRFPVEGAVITSARFRTEPRDSDVIRKEVDRLLQHRSETQPIHTPSCGSVFKNPEGDFAGRLIETASLKGSRIGGAEISSLHANFIVNRGGATAADVLALIKRAQATVAKVHGITLETEVRIVGRTP